MNREEYRLQTKIESVAEARSLLKRTKLLFAIATAGVIAANALGSMAEEIEEDAASIFFLVYIVFLIGFLLHNAWLIGKTSQLNKAYALFSVFFAPFSWIWLYPELVKPLRVIIGELEVPEQVMTPAKPTVEETERQERRNRVVLVVCALVLAAGGLVAYGVSEGWPALLRKQTDSYDYSLTYTDGEAGTYSSIIPDETVDMAEDGFLANFPITPDVTRDSFYADNLGSSVETVTYEAITTDKLYYVLVFNYAVESMSEDNPDFNVPNALRGGLDGLVQDWQDAVITSEEDIEISGKQAIRFTITINNEIFSGIAMYSNQSMYLVAVDYLDDDVTGPAEVQSFTDTFVLLNL